MSRQPVRRLILVSTGALVVAGSVLLAQTALAQLKLTDADARGYVQGFFETGPGVVIQSARVAFAKIPPASRGAVTAGLYIWTKAHLSSPAFRTAYAALRKERTPQARPHPGTVQEEAQRELAAKKAEIETTAKDNLARGYDKAQVENMRKASLSMYENPAYVTSLPVTIQATREADKRDYDVAMASWTTEFPADPLVRVATYLREFLDVTGDVDFAAKSTQNTEAGAKPRFVNVAYNDKPWQWQLSYAFGQEATASARTAAAAWLKELGK